MRVRVRELPRCIAAALVWGNEKDLHSEALDVEMEGPQYLWLCVLEKLAQYIA